MSGAPWQFQTASLQGHVWFTVQGDVWCPLAVSNCFSTGSCLVPHGSLKLLQYRVMSGLQYRVMSGAPWQFQTASVLGHVWCPLAVSNCFRTGSCLVPHGSFKLFQYRVTSGAPWQFETFSTGSCLVPHGSFTVLGHVWCPMAVWNFQYRVMSGAPWQFYSIGSCLVTHGSFTVLGHVWWPMAVWNCFSKLHTCYQLLVAYSPQFWFSTLTQGVNSSCECDSTLQGEDPECVTAHYREKTQSVWQHTTGRRPRVCDSTLQGDSSECVTAHYREKTQSDSEWTSHITETTNTKVNYIHTPWWSIKIYTHQDGQVKHTHTMLVK